MEQGVGSGEYLLVSSSPVFKWRYAADGDVVLGCNVGCVFCYYRFIDSTAPYIGTGRLKRLATPQAFVEFLSESRLVADGDLVIIGARGDGAYQVNDIWRVLELLDSAPKRVRVLVLRRVPFDRDVAEQLLSFPDRLLYGTTITPMGQVWGATMPAAQLRGLGYVVGYGVEPGRVIVEVGPVNEYNISEVPKILAELRGLGFRFFVYRGVSVGSWGVEHGKIVEELRRARFIEGETEKREYFYARKNELERRLEESVIAAAGELSMEPVRHTGLVYPRYGIAVAGNRKNRPRGEIVQLLKQLGMYGGGRADVKAALDRLGIEYSEVEELSDHVYRVHVDEAVTEDEAMRVGAWSRATVLFTRWTPSPDTAQLRKYFARKYVPTVNDELRKLAEKATR